MGYDSSGMLTIFENAQHISDTILDMAAGVAHIVEKPLFDKGFFLLSQPARILGEIRNDKIKES